MNERIRELAEQAGFETDRGPLIVPDPYIKVGGLCVGVPLEKFALSIVLECVDIVSKVPNGYRDYRNQIEDAMRADCLQAIQEHFGVE